MEGIRMIKILSSKNYEEENKNYGDCIVFIDDKQAIIYDCGSEEHAKRAIELLDENSIDKAIVVLSHNDDDHFKGIPYLIQEDRVDKLFTILLLKYKKELLDELDDDRRKSDSIARSITELYDNIASLSKKVTLKDVYENEDEFPSQMKRIGPEFDYMIKAAAKGINNCEGDSIDGETITNAASVQIELSLNSKMILLTGDCTPVAIPESVKLNTYDFIQLPHHGKPALADEVFERADDNIDITYIVSDNTGNSNGGSDDLNCTGHKVKNTKDGDILLTEESAKPSYSGRTLNV